MLVSKRFLVDIKKRKASSETENNFSTDLYTENQIIGIPVNKTENHCFFIAIVPKSHIILSVDSLGGCNASELHVVANYFKKYLTYQNKELYPK